MYAYQGVKQSVFITLLLMDMEVVFQFGTVMNSAAINNFVYRIIRGIKVLQPRAGGEHRGESSGLSRSGGCLWNR